MVSTAQQEKRVRSAGRHKFEEGERLGRWTARASRCTKLSFAVNSLIETD